MDRANDDRHAVLLAARDLFRLHGVHGTSMQQIADASKVPRGSLAFHFPHGKRQIVLEGIRYASDELTDGLRAGLSQTDPPTAMRAMNGMIGALLESSGWSQGSPTATIALEFAPEDDGLRKACRDHYRAMGATISEALGRAGLAPEETADLVALIVTSVEGAEILCRVEQSLEPMARVTRQVSGLLESRIAAAQTT